MNFKRKTVTRDVHTEIVMTGEDFVQLLRRAGIEIPEKPDVFSMTIGGKQVAVSMTSDVVIRYSVRESESQNEEAHPDPEGPVPIN